MSFQIRLDKKDPGNGDYKWLNDKSYLFCGVTIEAPGHLCLPGDAMEWGYAVVINNNHITLRGQFMTGNPVGKKLENLPQGSSIGLAVDYRDRLRLYVNGEDQGVVIGLGIPFPCYAFFDLIGPYRKAHGLAFSVPEGIKVPPSLKNMYKELEGDIKGFKVPDHGCLENWAKEGVLLLNTTLTVGAHKPNSHKSYGWQTFTDEVIQVVNAQCQKVVFLLWGNFAHKKEKLIDLGKHSVLKDAHPSPLSFGKFHNCKCFSRANEELKKAGLAPVDWML